MLLRHSRNNVCYSRIVRSTSIPNNIHTSCARSALHTHPAPSPLWPLRCTTRPCSAWRPRAPASQARSWAGRRPDNRPTCPACWANDAPATGLNDLAFNYFAQGRYTEAEPLLQLALEISEKTLGLEHPEVATVLESSAKLLRKMHRKAEASKLDA